MATAYAIALRQRALLLPWNFLLPETVASRKDVIAHWSAASNVCYVLLSAVDQVPLDRPVASSVSCIEAGHCFYCKTALPGSRGLIESCSNCYQEQAAMQVYLRQQYYFCFENTLRFSRFPWQLSEQPTTLPTQAIQPTLPTLTKAQAMQLAAKKKLGLPTS